MTGLPGKIPFRPGYGLFETLRVNEGKVLFLEEHWEALCAGAQILGLDVPLDFRSLAKTLPRQTGRWRWIVWDGGAEEFFQKETPPTPRLWTLELAPQRVGKANWDARYKTLSYLTHLQALASVSADEAILVNEDGRVASGARSNLFWVCDGRIYTPSVQCGCRAGVIRRWVLYQFAIVEGEFPLQELEKAEEAFCTNSWVGIQPVGKLLGRTLPLGPVTRDILQRYLSCTG